MRSQGIFLVFILSLTLALQYSYGIFREHYSDEKELVKQVTRLREDGERETLKQALLENQLENLKGEVLHSFGEKKSLAWSEKLWWQGLRAPASAPPVLARASVLLDAAKVLFRERKYADAGVKLRHLIQDFPTSKDIVEAHFLLAESLFLSGQSEASLDLIDQMMLRYPESEMTGFIMLRMGQILEKRNRPGDAREIYEIVLRQFSSSREIHSQAESLVKGLPRT